MRPGERQLEAEQRYSRDGAPIFVSVVSLLFDAPLATCPVLPSSRGSQCYDTRELHLGPIFPSPHHANIGDGRASPSPVSFKPIALDVISSTKCTSTVESCPVVGDFRTWNVQMSSGRTACCTKQEQISKGQIDRSMSQRIRRNCSYIQLSSSEERDESPPLLAQSGHSINGSFLRDAGLCLFDEGSLLKVGTYRRQSRLSKEFEIGNIAWSEDTPVLTHYDTGPFMSNCAGKGNL